MKTNERFEKGKTFLKTKNTWYYVSATGCVIKTDTSSLKDTVLPKIRIDGEVYIEVEGRRFLLKRIVAFLMKDYYAGAQIFHKDGNYKNCKLSNLLIIPKNFDKNLERTPRQKRIRMKPNNQEGTNL